MKQRLIIMVSLPMIVLILCSGCNKIDLSERCKITISGNTTDGADLNLTYEVSSATYLGPVNNDCETYIDVHGLKLNLQPDAVLIIHLQGIQYDESLPEGSFDVAGSVCEEGVTAEFSATAQGKAILSLKVSSGRIKIKEDEGPYDINIDFRISASSGGGTMEGNFTGMIDKVK